jgi:hypothetical protein
VDGELWQAIADLRALRRLASPTPAIADAAGAARTTALRLASTVDQQLFRALRDLHAAAATAAAAPVTACGGGCGGGDGGDLADDGDDVAASQSDLDRRLYRTIKVPAPSVRRPLPTPRLTTKGRDGALGRRAGTRPLPSIRSSGPARPAPGRRPSSAFAR